MWGTNHPVIQYADSLNGVAELGLDDETEALLLRDNLRRVYRL